MPHCVTERCDDRRPGQRVPPQVLLSVANEHHAGLRQLQFERVRREACMMRRVLSVCFNISDGLGMQEDARPSLHRTVPTPGFTAS